MIIEMIVRVRYESDPLAVPMVVGCSSHEFRLIIVQWVREHEAGV